MFKIAPKSDCNTLSKYKEIQLKVIKVFYETIRQALWLKIDLRQKNARVLL